MLHEELWKQNQKLVKQCLEHPFIQGLADESLEQEAFKDAPVKSVI